MSDCTNRAFPEILELKVAESEVAGEISKRGKHLVFVSEMWKEALVINHVLKQMRVSKSQQFGSDLSSGKDIDLLWFLRGPEGVSLDFLMSTLIAPHCCLSQGTNLCRKDMYKRKGGEALHAINLKNKEDIMGKREPVKFEITKKNDVRYKVTH